LTSKKGLIKKNFAKTKCRNKKWTRYKAKVLFGYVTSSNITYGGLIHLLARKKSSDAI